MLAFPLNLHAAEVKLGISGFVDASYYHKDSAGDTVEDAEVQTFSMDQAEVDFTSAIPGVGSARLDLNFTNTDENLKANDIVEQAYASVNFATFDLILGKFNVPMGAEGGEPTEMMQYSLALINEHGIPGDLTGAMIVYSKGTFGMNLYFVNGNDMQLPTFSDNNTEKTFGSRIAFSTEGVFTLGFSYISGRENATDTTSTDKNNLKVWDTDFTYISNGRLYIIAQYNNGTFERESNVNAGAAAKWKGYLLKMHYVGEGKYGYTLRYDKLEDEDATIFANATQKTSVDSYTGALTYRLSGNFGWVFEYRQYSADQKIWVAKDGQTTDSMDYFAVEFIYSF